MITGGLAEHIERIESGRRRLREAVERLGGSGLAATTPAGWTVKEMVAHIAFWEETVNPVVNGMYRAKEVPVEEWYGGGDLALVQGEPWPIADVHNAREAAWARTRSAEEVLARWDQAHERLLAVVRTVTEAEARREEYFDKIAAATYDHYTERLSELEGGEPRGRGEGCAQYTEAGPFLSDWHTPVSLGSRLRNTMGIFRSGVRLAWRASPAATAVIVGVLALEAALRPFQLHLSRLVVDRAVSNEPLLGAAVLAAMALAASQLLSPLSSLAQSLAGDRLTAHVGEKLILAANRWTGLARFEDPDFQDDLHRARNRAATGSIDLVAYGSRAVLLTRLLHRFTLRAVRDCSVSTSTVVPTSRMRNNTRTGVTRMVVTALARGVTGVMSP